MEWGGGGLEVELVEGVWWEGLFWRDDDSLAAAAAAAAAASVAAGSEEGWEVGLAVEGFASGGGGAGVGPVSQRRLRGIGASMEWL